MAAASTLALGSTIFQGISSVIGGMNEQKQANFQAQVKDEQAQQELKLAAERERDFKLQQDQKLAEYRAAAGAGGVHLDAGSTLASFVDFKGEEALQAKRIQDSGQLNAQRLRQSASMDRQAGSNAAMSGFARAGSSLLTGFANYKASTRKRTQTYGGPYG